MSTAVQRRRGTTAQHASFAGLNGELTVDTDKEVVVVHDGATAGGYPMMRENGSNSALALGSAASPSLKWDSNTGLYSPGLDQVAISTNGTGRLFVDASGNVNVDNYTFFVDATNNRIGIGVGSPSKDLHLGSTSATLRLGTDSSAQYGDIYRDPADGLIKYDSAQASPFCGHVFLTSGTERLRITAAGRLGLGTSAPQNTLHVVGPSATTNIGATVLVDSSAALAADIGGSIAFRGTDGTAVRTFGLIRGGKTDNNSASFEGYLAFETRVNGQPNTTERLRITTDGRVGVGTASPANLLDLFGTDCKLRVRDVGQTNGLEIYQQNSDGGSRIFAANNNYIAFGTNNTERGRWTNDGKLLIGTSTTLGSIAGFGTPDQQVLNVASIASVICASTGNNTYGGLILLASSRGGSTTIVQNGDELGQIRFAGADGTDLNTAGAVISAYVDGTPGVDDLPSRLTFSTTADGASSPTERLRITNTGFVGIGATPTRTSLLVGQNITSNSSSTTGEGIRLQGTIQSDITNAARGFISVPSQAAGFTLPTLYYYEAQQGTFSGTVTAQYGYYANSNLIGATNNYGFYSDIPSGTNRWNFYAAGTANNYFAGSVGINTTSPAVALDVYGAINLRSQYNLTWGGVYGAGIPTIVGDSSASYVAVYPAGSTSGEKLRVDSSGRLLVGTSSSFDTTSIQTSGSNAGLAVNSGLDPVILNRYTAASTGCFIFLGKSRSATVGTNTVVNDGDDLGGLLFRGADGTNFVQAARIAAQVDGTPGTNDMPGRLVFSVTRDGQSSPTEALRINNQGEVWSLGSAYGYTISSASGAGTTYYLISGRYSGTVTGGGTESFKVFTNGNVQNTNNSYAGISDIKLKENIVDATSQWEDIKALQVRKYNFKEGQTHTQIGLIAQEVELVSPGLVNESPDRDAEGNDLGTVTKSVNYSVLYMKAVKALQEAMERIEALEAKVAALEAA